MRIILFSGTHGVGKGFFLEKVKDHVKQYNICTASTLIGKYKSATDMGYKKVGNVKSNQEILITAINKEMCNDSRDLIIDGHLCIYNKDGEIERIPEYFFVETNICNLILLQDDPEIISERLKKRDKREVKAEDIQKMQNEKLTYARQLKEKLGISFAVITHEVTGEQFINYLERMGGDQIE